VTIKSGTVAFRWKDDMQKQSRSIYNKQLLNNI